MSNRRLLAGPPLAVCLWFVGCGPAAEPVEVLDLVREFRYTEVAAEPPVIDLGTPGAAPALIGGWSWNQTDPAGNTFVWAVGPRSGIRVYFPSARGLDVRMTCRAFRYPGAPVQRLAVLWDGREVAELDLTGTFAEHSFRLPAALAVAGEHRLELVPTYYGLPAAAGVAGRPPRQQRKLSFACDRIEFGGESAPGEVRGEADTLWIPATSEVSFFLEPEQELQLRWDGLAPRGGSRLEVVWEVEGAAPVSEVVTRESVLVLGLPLAQGGMSPSDAPWLATLRAAKLTLRAGAGRSDVGSREGEEGVILRNPRLTVDGRSLPRPDRVRGSRALGSGPVVSVTPSLAGERDPTSILLWIVDTLRVDRLGLYGHERPVSPNFDALAERSTVFERAVAQSSWTRPTVATLLTGLGPERHGVRELSHGLDESLATLPERLQELGYATAGFSANAHVTGDTGFEQGFDRFRYGAVDVDTLAEWALDWLDEVTAGEPDQPFFLMILSVEPHASFDPAEPFRSRFASEVQDAAFGTVEHLRALSSELAPSTPEVVDKLFLLYDAEIAWNDHAFGEFRREVNRRGRNPAIVVVADHGEAFEERGVFGHSWDLHREVLDIPFLIQRPGQTDARRVSLPVQQADLLPTLIEIAGGRPEPGIEGDSLVPLLGPERTATPGRSEALSDRLLLSTLATFRRPAASLVRGRYKLIELRRPGQAPMRQLFDRVADPKETRDLAGEWPLLAGRLARLLREQLEFSERGGVSAPEVEVDEETRRRLEALGYIGPNRR